jgi:hypothetical protein
MPERFNSATFFYSGLVIRVHLDDAVQPHRGITAGIFLKKFFEFGRAFQLPAIEVRRLLLAPGDR